MTGVQTCALPISVEPGQQAPALDEAADGAQVEPKRGGHKEATAQIPTRPRPADLIAHLGGDNDIALVHGRSRAGEDWIHLHPCPTFVEDICVYPITVDTCELEEAEHSGLIVWRVYSSSRPVGS